MATVGYFSNGGIISDMVNEITSAGHTAVQLNDLSAAQLAGIDILYLWNADNNTWGGAGAYQTDVTNALNNGLKLLHLITLSIEIPTRLCQIFGRLTLFLQMTSPSQ